jgi:hypothetical protein
MKKKFFIFIILFLCFSLKATDPLTQLPLAGTEIRFEKKKSKKRPLQFTLASPHGKFKDLFLNGDTKEEIDAWMQAIRDSIDIANPGIFGKDLPIVLIKSGGSLFIFVRFFFL